MKTIRLRAGKERSLLRRHPWVFDGAVAKGGGDAGETVRVEGSEGQFLAWAAFSPASKIRARAWSFVESDRIDADFVARLVQRAVQMRSKLALPSDGIRLVHGESDGLPGLVVDRYGDTLVAQFGAVGVERFKSVIADALLLETGLTQLYERSDASSRALEGLPSVTGWLRGTGATDLVLSEHHYRLALSIAEGHKTGFYLDQRQSRKTFADYCARHRFKHALNCFSYTGGFTVAGLLGAGGSHGVGAQHITSIDSSGAALRQAEANLALNGIDPARATFLDADVNASLRQFVANGQSFDAIVLDPPKFAPTAAHADRAARAYKDINRLAFKLLAPGGVLFTFSCSGGISADLFHKIVASAGTDAQVDAYFLERLAAASDHPMTVDFPEGEYLKGWVVMKKA